MRPAVRIRKARPADALAILELENHFPSDRMSLRSVRNFLKSPRAQVWVAVLGNPASPFPGHGPAAVACLILLTRARSRAARIYSVVVDTAARGRGIGRNLVLAAERAARRRGCAEISLEVRGDNVAARALYAGLGYRESRHLPGFYDDGADGLKLCKPLLRRGR